MMLRSLSMTGVAVDMFVQIQFGAVRGSTVVSIVRRHSAAPVAASSAVSVFDAESVYTTVFVPCAVRMPWATSGAVSIELPDSISIDTSLSIWVFHLSARRPIDCLDSADSPRFQPLRSISPPHVSHSPVRPLCAYADQEIPASQQARTRHVVRISVISPSVKSERLGYDRDFQVSTLKPDGRPAVRRTSHHLSPTVYRLRQRMYVLR